MADLTDAANETLVAMTDLERRAGEVSQAVAKLLVLNSHQTHELDGDEAKFLERFESASTHLGTLQTRLTEAGGQLAQRIADQTAAVDQQSRDLDTKHADVRRHLEDLRQAIRKLTTEVKTLEQNTQRDLAKINGETVLLLGSTVTGLHDIDETLRTVTDPAVNKVESAIEDRRQAFKKFVDGTLVPRIDKESKEFDRRIDAMSAKLNDLLAKSHKKTAEQARVHISRLVSVSGTDWYGRSGDCQTGPRTKEMQRQGQQKSQTVTSQANSTVSVGGVFADLMQDAIKKYQRIYAIPEKITKITSKVVH